MQTPMERVPGVSSVGMRGGASRQVKIFVDPVRLAERGIRLADLRSAIRARNRDVSGGDLDSGKRRYLLRTIGRFETVEELENLVIAERDGAFVRLRDVGRAELGFAEVRSYAYSEGKPILAFAVSRQIGSNVIQIKRDMLAAVAELNEGVLAEKGLRLLRTADDVVYVTDAVFVVQRNLAIGAALAIGVLFLFLRSAPATLIGAIGIPICTVAAFLGLLVTGRTINVISLAGVAFAIGMTLDNNIVVLENIYRHLKMGKQRMDAALDVSGRLVGRAHHRARQVGQNRSQTDGDEQQRLVLLGDGQEDQHSADAEHDQVLPRQGREARLVQKTHDGLHES